jgi:A-factor type gamma-butyrolactone 1'-reductase (1S-forming)
MTEVLNRFRLDGRTAIITGIGPGVGEHVARAYAEVGANVVLAARTAAKLDALANEINALGGGRALAVPTDVAVKDDLINLVSKAHAAFGPIHILFNNAAAGVIGIADGIWGNTDEVWTTAMNANVLAAYRLAELTTEDMQAHGKGSIITVQSLRRQQGGVGNVDAASGQSAGASHAGQFDLHWFDEPRRRGTRNSQGL